MARTVFSRLLRVMLAVMLAVCVCCVPTRKAHAIVPAVAAGAAVFADAAVAAGVSEGLLAAGMGALMAAGTGIGVVAGNWTGDKINQWLNNGGAIPDVDTDEHYYLPGWARWDRLSDSDLAELDRQGIRDEEDYMHAWWGNALLQAGLLDEIVGDGGEPEYEPNNGDDDGDGEPDYKYNRWINAAAIVGAGAGSVAVDVVADVLADNVKRMLFSGDSDTFRMDLTTVAKIDNHPIAMRVPQYVGPFSIGSVGIVALSRYDNNRYENQYVPESSVVVVRWNSSSSYWYTDNPSSSHAYYQNSYYDVGKGTWSDVIRLSNSYRLASSSYISPSGNFSYSYLNPLYGGLYDFGNSKKYDDGAWTGVTADEVSYDYGQMDGVSSQLPYNVMGDTYNNYYQYLNSQAPEGQTMVVSLPSISDEQQTQLYTDYVHPLPSEQVVPVPDALPEPGPGPEPEPELTQFQKDFRDRVTEMLERPLEQLFPFCLITDLHRLVTMVSDTVSSSSEPDDELHVPLSEFGLPGTDELIIDVRYLKNVGNDVRPFTTALFVSGLLVGSFAFFLKRGGE